MKAPRNYVFRKSPDFEPKHGLLLQEEKLLSGLFKLDFLSVHILDNKGEKSCINQNLAKRALNLLYGIGPLYRKCAFSEMATKN